MTRTNGKQIDLEQEFLIDDFYKLPHNIQQEILFALLGEVQDKIDAKKDFADRVHWLKFHNHTHKRIDFPCLYNEDRADILASLPQLQKDLMDIEHGREHSSLKSASFQSIIGCINQNLSERAKERAADRKRPSAHRKPKFKTQD